MENRNGLVVAAQGQQAATVAEREAALEMLDERVMGRRISAATAEDHAGSGHAVSGREIRRGAADRGVAPHVSEYTKGKESGQERLTDSGTERPAARHQSAEDAS